VFASCRTAVLRQVIFTLTLAQKCELSNLKLSLINSLLSFKVSITYIHEMAKQKEDIKCKRILLTAREKQGIVNYCLERTFLVDVFITRFCVQATEKVSHHRYTPKKNKKFDTDSAGV
jgi:hypothetical protein